MSGYAGVPQRNSKSNIHTGTSDNGTSNTESKKTIKGGQNKDKTLDANVIIKDPDYNNVELAVTNEIKAEVKIDRCILPQAINVSFDDNCINKRPSNSQGLVVIGRPIDYKAITESESLTQPFENAETTINIKANTRQERHTTSAASTCSYILFKVAQPVNDTLQQRLVEVPATNQCVDDEGSLNDKIPTAESEISAVDALQTVITAVTGVDDRIESRDLLKVRLFNELGTFDFSKAAIESKLDVEKVIQSLMNKVAADNSRTMTESNKCICHGPLEEAATLKTLDNELLRVINAASWFLKNVEVTSVDTVTQQDFRHTFKIKQSEGTDDDVDDDNIEIESLEEEPAGHTTSVVTKVLTKDPCSSDNFKTVLHKPVVAHDIRVAFETIRINTPLPQEICNIIDTRRDLLESSQHEQENSSELILKSSQTEIPEVMTNTEKNDDMALDIVDKFPDDITKTLNQSEDNITESQFLNKVDLLDNITASDEDNCQYYEKLLTGETNSNYAIEDFVKQEMRLNLSNTQMSDKDVTLKASDNVENDITVDFKKIIKEEQTIETHTTKIELVEKPKEVLKLSDSIEKTKFSETVIESAASISYTLLTTTQELEQVPAVSETPEDSDSDNLIKYNNSVQLKSLDVNKSDETVDELKARSLSNEDNIEETQYTSSFPFRLQSVGLLEIFDYNVNAQIKNKMDLNATSYEPSGIASLIRLASKTSIKNKNKVDPDIPTEGDLLQINTSKEKEDATVIPEPLLKIPSSLKLPRGESAVSLKASLSHLSLTLPPAAHKVEDHTPLQNDAPKWPTIKDSQLSQIPTTSPKCEQKRLCLFKACSSRIKSFFSCSCKFFRRKLQRRTQEYAQASSTRCKNSKNRVRNRRARIVCIDTAVLN